MGKTEEGKLPQTEQVWEENWRLLCPQLLEVCVDKACDCGQCKPLKHPMLLLLSVCQWLPYCVRLHNVLAMDESLLFPFLVCCPLASSFWPCETFTDARRCLSTSLPMLVTTYCRKANGGRQNIRDKSKHVSWTCPLRMSNCTLQYHVWAAGLILNVNFGENTSSSLDFHVPI